MSTMSTDPVLPSSGWGRTSATWPFDGRKNAAAQALCVAKARTRRPAWRRTPHYFTNSWGAISLTPRTSVVGQELCVCQLDVAADDHLDMFVVTHDRCVQPVVAVCDRPPAATERAGDVEVDWFVPSGANEERDPVEVRFGGVLACFVIVERFAAWCA